MIPILYEKKITSAGSQPFHLPAGMKLPVIRLLLAALAEWSGIFEKEPVIERMGESPDLLVIFPDSMVVCDDFLETYQELLGVLSTVYSVELLGTAPACETACLSISLADSVLSWKKENTSGHDFDTLSDFCIHFTAETMGQADYLELLLRSFDCNKGCVALPCFPGELGEEWRLKQKKEGSYFYYPSAEEVTEAERLACLSLRQKEKLWELFLEDGLCPAEFDWLFACYEEDRHFSLLAWELSLQMALQRLQITVVNRSKNFSVLDAAERPLRFDFIHGCAAERIFLKILFQK